MKLIIILLYCYLVVFTLGQLTRFTLEITEINVHLADVLVGFLVSSWLVWKLSKRDKFILPPLAKQIFLFFSLCFISLALNSLSLLSGRERLVSWLYLLRWIFYAGLYFVIYDLVQSAKCKVQSILSCLMITGTATAVLGLLQYIFVPDTRFLEKYGWDPHLYRVIGTFFDPGFLGAILVLTLILIVSSLHSDEKMKHRGIIFLVGMIVYVALALTYSRASYLAYLGAMGTIAWVKKAPKFFLAVLVAGIITVFLLPRPGGEGVRLERESTIKFRLINWRQSLVIAKEHLLFGVGFNAYRYAQRDYGFLEFANWRASHAGGGADSSLLFVLATTGIFGLLAYLWLWGKILVNSAKAANLLVLASVIALLVHSWFVNSLFYPWIMGWLWILLGTTEAKA
ncbi:MAG: O-antigen ligase family protein [Patescibacteria group bacterium]